LNAEGAEIAEKNEKKKGSRRDANKKILPLLSKNFSFLCLFAFLRLCAFA
jgi:hypothetical protein